MNPPPRRAARLLVIDVATGAVLLLQYEDGGTRFWATPGGAIEGDETFEAAAIREAREELAVSFESLTPLWRRTAEFSFRGIPVRQDEQYFLVRVAVDDVALGNAVEEAHRDEGILAARWWSLEEIEATRDRIFPEDLATRLRELVGDAGETGTSGAGDSSRGSI